VSLARPAANPAALAGFPARSITEAYPYVRIHQQVHDPQWFCTCGGHRFDPPSDTVARFGTCYLSGHPLGAFIEKFGDLGVITRERIDAHRLAHLQVPAARLADTTDRRALAWGVTAELAGGGDYDGAQQWAERLFQAGFAGIWYAARDDPGGDLHSLALFGKPGLHPEAFVSQESRPIGDDLIDEVAARFGLEVIPAAAL
jgi:hypothetical protein